MPDKPIKVLLIEDSPGDIRLLQDMLHETGHNQFTLEYAMNLSNGLQRLREDKFEVVLLDLGLPDSQGLETLHRVRDSFPIIGVVMILTGLNNEQVGIQALREGADDYIVKGQVNARGLNRALRYSIERKQAELKIVRLNRVYAVLGGINGVIVRIRDQQRLFEEVCIIAVEEGLYRLAWIGLVNPETHLIKPVAHHGFNEGYLENLHISIDDTPEGRGPAGTAIREGRYVVCNNIEQDPIMAPWREEALKRGYRSLTAFPLKIGAQIIGSFTLFATEPDFFDKQEIPLLQELVADISFVLEMIESEKQRIQAETAVETSAHQWRTTFDAMNDAVCLVDTKGKILRGNKAMLNFYKKSFPEIIGRNLCEVVHGAPKHLPECPFFRMQLSKQRETQIIPMNDRWFEIIVDPMLDTTGQLIGAVHIITDITARKQAEDRQQLALGILQILNRPNNLIKIIEDILIFLKAALQYDAVGIRLHDGEDYPYFVQNGFTDEFVAAEQYLCARGTQGAIILDANGKPYLECMCGNIVSGRTDLAKPYFTAGGSFWTNSTTEMLASTMEADRLAQTRNKCNTAGYESVALIPIRAKDKIIGLLQLNDRHRDRFTLELIQFFEGMTPTIGLAVSRREAEEKLQESYTKSRRTLEETVQAITSVLETRDPYTAGHERRDAQLACAIAQEMGLSEDQIEGLRIASLLHDIGKIAVPAEILSKPTKLTNIEFSLIKVHSETGYNILKDVEFPWPIAQIVYQHHERINGSGYPQGLKGDEIIVEARILAVADVVEAMSSHRPYRPALGLIPALDEINKNKGILYDPLAVDACLRCFQENGFKFE